MIQNAYISMGSNLGDRAGYLLLAVRGMIAAGLAVKRLSSIYETEPVVVVDQPFFLNMVAELGADIPFSAEQVLARLLRVEYALGRSREVPMGPRTIDLDLLLYGKETRATEFLTLPHPRLHLRRFVLMPLVELCPMLVHPSLSRTMSDLLQNLHDPSEVQVWNPHR